MCHYCDSWETNIANRDGYDFCSEGCLQAYMIRSNKIGPNTKRETLGLAHGEFRRRLISKAELRGCKVLVPQNEFKTTMVCGICFEENLNVGASEVFHCKECGLIAGRDVNSPRDIFIRQLVL